MSVSELILDSRPLDLAAVDALGQRVRAQLEAKRAEIYREIRSYPPPIPACDQQFNYLLEQRAQVAQELQRLDALRKTALGPDAAFVALHDFIHHSTFIDEQSV